MAWNALRESANREKTASMTIKQRRENGRFKKLTDVVRFIGRSSVDAEVQNASDEIFSYNEKYIVSTKVFTRQFFNSVSHSQAVLYLNRRTD